MEMGAEMGAEISQESPFLSLSKGTQRIALPQSRHFAIKFGHAVLEDYRWCWGIVHNPQTSLNILEIT